YGFLTTPRPPLKQEGGADPWNYGVVKNVGHGCNIIGALAGYGFLTTPRPPLKQEGGRPMELRGGEKRWTWVQYNGKHLLVTVFLPPPGPLLKQEGGEDP